MADRDDTLRRVQGLINKANDAAVTPEERETLLAAADKLMAKYAIEQFELEAAKPHDEREKPVVTTIVAATARNWRNQGTLDSIFYSLARHCGVMIGKDHEYKTGERTWRVVGFEADVRYLEMLYTSIFLTLVSKMEPGVDPNLSEVENYANLREAGVPVERILPKLGYPYHIQGEYEQKWDDRQGRYAYQKKQNRTVLGRFRRQYAKLCAERGVEPVKGATGEGYQLCYLDAFSARIDARLRELKAGRDEVNTGHELVVADRSDEVKNLLWETWPELKPHPKDCNCERCHWCGEADCQFEKCRRYAANKDKPIPKSHYRELQYNWAGAAAGRAAANAVNLAGGSIGTTKKKELA